jgi:hypothetical protein
MVFSLEKLELYRFALHERRKNSFVRKRLLLFLDDPYGMTLPSKKWVLE